MANIKVTIDYSISDGTKLKFRTPCESTEVEGLVVTYPIKNGVGNAVKTFTFVDAHGTELSGVGNVFTSDVMIEVMLDVTKGRAFIKNADTNSYIEDIKVTVKRMDEERQVIFAEAGKSVKECNDATKKADEVANALNLTAEEIRSGGFVEALKETNNGHNFTLWVGTQEEYEAEKDTIPYHTFCIITDDHTEEDLNAAIGERAYKSDVPAYINLGRDSFNYDLLYFDYFIANLRSGGKLLQNVICDYVQANQNTGEVWAAALINNTEFLLHFYLEEDGVYRVDATETKLTDGTSTSMPYTSIIGVKLPV